MGRYDDPESPRAPPDAFSYPLPHALWNPDAPSARWINHSTYLVEVDGVRLLTDPIWSRRCSPVQFVGPKRRHPPALSLEELPPVHAVLISHDHYDHLDKKSVLQLHRRFPRLLWLVPSGVERRLFAWGVRNVRSCSWWDAAACEEFTATAVPAQHFSGRRGRDLNTTLWVGWVIEWPRGKRLYFAGDTGYNPIQFKEIGARFAPVDLSLIPIGSYVPRAFMSPVHIDPAQAVKIHREVGSRLSLAMHWKTFRLSDEPMHQPPYDLFLALQREGIDPASFLAVEPGCAVNW
jgi:N-acyl-phosphatidylethanolamine-hydrolysing phospholipase D